MFENNVKYLQYIQQYTLAEKLLLTIKILNLRVGFVKQNISFAGEALEQVGDGRG